MVENKQIYDWLIVFFIHQIEIATGLTDELINEITSQGFGKNNKIILILDKIHDNDNGVFFSTELYELMYLTQEQEYVFTQIENFHPTESNNLWKDALQFVFKLYKHAKRRLLLTWSHGAGFGINFRSAMRLMSQVSTVKNNFKITAEQLNRGQTDNIFIVRSSNIIRLDKESLIQPSIDFTSILQPTMQAGIYRIKDSTPECDCKKIEILWISDLARALEMYLEKSSIDILIMMNCNMQLFDTGFLLKEKVKYLVASESPMDWNGYDYKGLLLLLNNFPLLSTKKVLETIIRDYVSKYKSGIITGGQERIKKATLFANSLKYYNILLKLLNTTIKIILLKIDDNSYIEILRKIRRNEIFTISRVKPEDGFIQLIDLGLFIRLLSKHDRRNVKLRVISALIAILLKRIAVVKPYIGGDLLKNDKLSVKKYGCNGISLFFPEEEDFFKCFNKFGYCAYYNVEDKENKHLSPIIRLTVWDDFLKKFFEKLSTINQHKAAV